MLRVGLRGLDQAPAEVSESVSADNPQLQDLGFQLSGPVHVAGRLTAAGPGQYYWRGRLDTTIDRDCRRCLATVRVPVAARMDILFTEDGQTDDPEAYLIPRRAAELDLGDAVREELILAVPEYVLCREDCRGMCPRCGVDLNAGPCDCTPVPGPGGSVFEVLRRLGPEDTR